MKYKYEIEGNRVTAHCNYAGKRIQASATCCSEDEFDANIGMKIAAYRLDIKITKKRYKKSIDSVDKLIELSAILQTELKDRLDYFYKMEDTLNQLESDYDEFMRAYS